MLATLLVGALLAPRDLTGHAGTAVGDKVFVTGGTRWVNEGHFLREAWLVDPVRGSWETLPAPKYARGMAAAAELNGSVYVAGGVLWSQEALAKVERFDLKTARWSEVAPLRVARSRLSMVALNGKLYVLGGIQQSEKSLNTDVIEEFDPAKGAWRDVGRLRHARHGFAARAWGGRIYVFGGNDEDSERSAEVWDPTTGKSTDLPAMPAKRGFPQCLPLGKRLVLFGGRDSAGHPSAFDPATSKWQALSAPDLDLNRSITTTIGNRLWSVGGEFEGEGPILRSFDLSAWK